MAQVKILIEGYARKLANGWVANSTCCLITAENKKIITDPGCNREKLLAALAQEGLATKDIDYVFLSHGHPDHILLAGIFRQAKHLTFDGGMMYNQDQMTEFPKDILGPDIIIVNTPGHVPEHLALIVKTPEGKVAIAGDVIWWTDDEEQKFNINQPDHSEAKGMNLKELIKSREKLLTSADYIIPGHGKMFRI